MREPPYSAETLITNTPLFERDIERPPRSSPLPDYRIAVAPSGHRSCELLQKAFDVAGIRLKIALESPNQELLWAVASGGAKHVAVIPGDAFAEEDVKGALELKVKGSEKRFGGKYALYMRAEDASVAGLLAWRGHRRRRRASGQSLPQKRLSGPWPPCSVMGSDRSNLE